MQLPDFPETRHPLIQPLLDCSDQALVRDFQSQPDQGKYFTAIFCRFGALSYTLIRNMARSPLQVDYLFARVWRNIFHELGHLVMEPTQSNFDLQAWVLSKVATCISQDELPPIETIQYSLNIAPPPLWCYLQRALDHVSPLSRLLLVLSQTFHWQEQRIMGVMAVEGQELTAAEIAQQVQSAYHDLQDALPVDIQEIYFSQAPQQGLLFPG
ncbi:MAG: sigma-70 family RNA polymerase sigma factor [Acaryochloridaceae cyanobacterium SU_2_1]|nr:sigma-70 family RNA polymerase sigma factor [Acaryochloridaceae cyanobacterium SU_2_1]